MVVINVSVAASAGRGASKSGPCMDWLSASVHHLRRVRHLARRESLAFDVKGREELQQELLRLLLHSLRLKAFRHLGGEKQWQWKWW